MKIKVGDKVKFRSDLKVGLCYNDCAWIKENNRWLGKVATVSYCYGNYFRIKNYKSIGNIFTTDMLDQDYHDQKQEIHITTDGVTTYAVMKQNGKIVKHSETICSQDDDFNFLTGAKIALERLDQQDSKFVPYLVYKNLLGVEKNYGFIGEPTSMTLPFGEPLYVGDVVETYNMDSKYSNKHIVVKPVGGESFVMGLSEYFFKNGICENWQIRKFKSYKELKNCEVIDTVLAITEE